MKKPKKVPPINFIVNLGIYPFDVMVSIGQTEQQIGKSLDKCFPTVLSESDINLVRYSSETSSGTAVMFSNNASVLRIRELPQSAQGFGTLAHEIFHIVTFVLARVGIKLKMSVSDEAYAYLIGHLTKEIYAKTNKYY